MFGKLKNPSDKTLPVLEFLTPHSCTYKLACMEKSISVYV